jgi:small nuclear ribonucleoprotein (snRNP)-like protein
VKTPGVPYWTVAEVRATLTKKLRVSVSDERVFYGYLNCYDKQGNIILINATECRPARYPSTIHNAKKHRSRDLNTFLLFRVVSSVLAPLRRLSP